MRNFTTLTIRNLDSEVVRIMNQIADDKGVQTGQAIFEKAIQQYEWLTMKLESEQEMRAIENKDSKIEIRKLQSELAQYKKLHTSYKAFQSVLHEIDSNIIHT